jgi:hypothetical protein
MYICMDVAAAHNREKDGIIAVAVFFLGGGVIT